MKKLKEKKQDCSSAGYHQEIEEEVLKGINLIYSLYPSARKKMMSKKP
jgi:hypothetical protein